MTLLLGPPGAGKTTLLLALAGKLDPDLKVHSHVIFLLYSNQFTSSLLVLIISRVIFFSTTNLCYDDQVSGRITYCGHELKEFVAKKTCAYIGQHDLHYGEMTVRETLDFSGRCLGVGTRYQMLEELLRREKQAGIKPDPEIDAFMKATAIYGQKTNLQTDYVLKVCNFVGTSTSY